MPCLNLLLDYNNLLLDYNNLLLDYNNLLPDYNNHIIIYYYYNPRININPSCPVYCFFYISVSTVWIFVESVRVFCSRTHVKSQFLCLYFRLFKKQADWQRIDLAWGMAVMVSSAKPKWVFWFVFQLVNPLPKKVLKKTVSFKFVCISCRNKQHRIT